MQYLVKRSAITSEKTACAIVAIFAGKRLSDEARQLDRLYDGMISAVTKSGDISGRLAETLLLHTPAGALHKRLLLVGCGKAGELDILKYRKIINAATGLLKTTGAADAVSALNTLKVKNQTVKSLTRMHILLSEENFYQYDQTLSTGKTPARLKRIKFIYSQPQPLKQIQSAIVEGKAIAGGVMVTRQLANLPANICTPIYLAAKAAEIKRRQSKLSLQVLDEKAMQKLGMGALLSVSAGSAQPARLIALHYRGAARTARPVVLIGKGITFDSGGISLKPGAGMDEMKFDMCGAASVLGVMQAVNAMQLPLNVVGLIASAENMPGGKATRPGDVVTSMSGQTIEILNTDAEGRLVLCDALTYAKRYDPDVVIDIATLTGACLVALGHEASGLMSNSDKLSDALLAAGQATGDRAWRLPVWQEYQPLLNSNFADMANIGGRWAGTITAGCFLERFARDYAWAHLDIAGTAWHMGKNKGATGRPVALLTHYLMQRARIA